MIESALSQSPGRSEGAHVAKADSELALELTGIEKNFGGVKALRGANLAVRRGEIMGLCGENGAGKSTLIKVLAGVHPHGSYGGTVRVDGQLQALSGPSAAFRAGIAVVHQELMLVPELSVAENLLLGREPRRFGLVDDIRLESMALSQLRRFGFAEQIDPSKSVAELGIGLQQIVEIVRALSLDARILVLDEPTAALTGQETQVLMSWLQKLKNAGTTSIYVSHRLDEVFQICDRVTVLRDGRTEATLVTAQTNADEIVRLMVGRDVGTAERAQSSTAHGQGPAVLEVSELSVHSPAGRHAVERVSFSVRKGEIVAVCGAMGSGRTALLSALFGSAHSGTSGRVSLSGAPLLLDSPLSAIKSGVAFVPEDRKGRGLVLGMTVAENLALPSLGSARAMGQAARFGYVDPVSESELAEKRIRALRIRGAADAPVATLSGGNQQKVVLGKWLEHPPKLLLLDEPTRGVDVGAREEIYAILRRLAADGVAILFASSDLSEVLRLADRVLVLRLGTLVGELDAATASEEAIVQLSTRAAGHRLSQPPQAS